MARRPVEDCDFTVRDSWAVVTLGDLHMEDDMTTHELAREDCIHALKDLSIVASPLQAGAMSSRMTLKAVVEQLHDKQAGDLSAAQLEILLTHKREGDICQSYLVSLGDLGRKEYVRLYIKSRHFKESSLQRFFIPEIHSALVDSQHSARTR